MGSCPTFLNPWFQCSRMKYKEKGGKGTGYKGQENCVFILKEKLLSNSSFSVRSCSISPCGKPTICYPGGEGKSLDDFCCSGNVCWSLLSLKFSYGALALCDTQLFRQLFGWTMCPFVLWGTGTVPSLDTAIIGGILPHKASFTENDLMRKNAKEVSSVAVSVA